MRLVILCMLSAISMAAWGSFAQDAGLKHDWREERLEHGVTFISKHAAPAPYSDTGEPEATLTLLRGGIEHEHIPMPKMLKAEIADIRKGKAMANFLDDLDGQGGKPDGDIVSYIEEIEGQPVGFIKYRVAGIGGKTQARSVMHAILLYKGYILHCHLMVRSPMQPAPGQIEPGYIEEVRGDQLRALRAALKQ